MNKREFTLLDLVGIFKKRWWIMVISALVMGSLFAFYSVKTYVPEYTSAATFYISPSSGMTEYSTDDITKLNWAMKMINSYMAIVKTDDFAIKLDDTYKNSDEYKDEYAAAGMNKAKVRSTISTVAMAETNLFKVYIKTSDKNVAYHLAQLLETLVPEHIAEVSEKDETVHVADRAKEPGGLSNSDNMPRNTLIGFLLGAFVSFLVLFLVDLFDVRVKSEDEVLNNYTVPLLGAVPNFSKESKNKRGYKYG